MLLQMGLLLRNKLISKIQVVKMHNPLEEYCDHKLHCFNNSYLKKKKTNPYQPVSVVDFGSI